VQLTPRYGAGPVITLDGDPADVLVPAVRQRRRLAAACAAFTEEQWAHPSRCERWSTRDVLVHLDSTNAFWAYSIAEGLRGEPTQLLATFDPVASPAALVAAAGDTPSAQVRDQFLASTETLLGMLESLDDDAWSTMAEAPPGHVTISAVVHHALWDSWVHERDILLPLGLTPDREPDEVGACLRYAAALSPAFAVTMGAGGRGVLALTTSDPDLAVVVDVDGRVAVREGPADADLELTGDAVDLLEALSLRRPLDQPVPETSAWLLHGLAEIFDVG
jgi:uncharacterized protein (TIGR03083 family)